MKEKELMKVSGVTRPVSEPKRIGPTASRMIESLTYLRVTRHSSLVTCHCPNGVGGTMLISNLKWRIQNGTGKGGIREFQVEDRKSQMTDHKSTIVNRKWTIPGGPNGPAAQPPAPSPLPLAPSPLSSPRNPRTRARGRFRNQ